MEEKKFSIVIPTYNSSKYLDELLTSTLDLRYLDEIVISDDSSDEEEFKKIKDVIKRKKFSSLSIKLNQNKHNLGGFKNKYKGVELSKNNIVYQVDSDNIISSRTVKFLNRQKNLELIQNGNLFLPSKIKLFRKFKNIESLLFFRNNDVLFTKLNKELDIKNVINELNKEELNKKDSSFKDRTLKSILKYRKSNISSRRLSKLL